MIFYIGIYMAHWIPSMEIPFMVSRRVLQKRKKWHKPSVSYALDSGGFTELSTYGQWTISEQQYVDIVHRIVDNMGIPAFVAPMDRMCEPFICKKTNKSVQEHQKETVENYVVLRGMLDSSIYLLPVLQGYTLEEYTRCVRLYQEYGVDLTTYSLVGLGSICRRQKTKEGIETIKHLVSLGLKLHGFGLKTTALKQVSSMIASSDSMAWSFAGRRIPDSTGKCKNRANDFSYMLEWYSDLKSKVVDIE